MKAGIKISSVLVFFQITLAACDPVPQYTEYKLPKLPEGGIVYLDMTRWMSPNLKDSTEVLRLWDAMHLASTLQGIVNRDEPRLYIDYVKSVIGDVDKYWWDKYREAGAWLAGKEVVTVYDPVDALELFRDKINGIVAYDTNEPSTSNVASTIAGVEDLVAVRYDTTPGSIYNRLVKRNLEVKQWLVNPDGSSKFHSKIEPYQWAADNYLTNGKCNPEYAGYYIDLFWHLCPSNANSNHHQLSNHDFFISKKAFFFDLSPWGDEPATDAPDEPAGADLSMLKVILSHMYRLNGGRKFCHIGGFPAWAFKYSNHKEVGGKHTPVESEWKFAEIIGEFNAFKDADAIAYGAMANASFWQHYPLKDKYTQKWVTREQLKAKGYLKADGTVDLSKRYILFYIGDYDASPWIYQRMPDLWEDTSRGKVPLMWSISPILCRRAPMVMDYLYETATENDYFAAADNGAGYLNPGSLEEPRAISGFPSGVDAWAAHCKPFYEQWGMTITGFIIDGNAKRMSEEGLKSYATFSCNGIVPQKATPHLVDGMPVLPSQGGAGGDTVDEAVKNILAYIKTMPDRPFYWFRTVLKTPTWHLAVKEGIEKADPQAVWLNGPEYFELLRCYYEERQ